MCASIDPVFSIGTGTIHTPANPQTGVTQGPAPVVPARHYTGLQPVQPVPPALNWDNGIIPRYLLL